MRWPWNKELLEVLNLIRVAHHPAAKVDQPVLARAVSIVRERSLPPLHATGALWHLLRIAFRQPMVGQEEVVVHVHEAAAIEVGGGARRVPGSGEDEIVTEIHRVGVVEITGGQEMRAGEVGHGGVAR